MKKKMFLIIIGLVLLLMATPLFAGGAEEDVATVDGGNLVMWMPSYVQAAVDYLQASAQALIPHRIVEVISYPMGTYDVKMSAALAAKADDPDVMMSHEKFLPKLINGGVVDITDRLAPFVDDFIPASLQPLSNAQGRIFGLPFEITATSFFYNQEIYNEAGIAPAKTLDEFLDNARKLKAMGKYVTAEDLLEGGIVTFEILLSMQGGGYFNSAGELILGTDAGMGVEAARWFKRLVDAGVIFDAKVNSAAWWDAMRQGTVASLLAYNWYPKAMRANFNDADPSYGEWRMDGPPVAFEGGPASSLYNNVGAMINNNSPDIDDAWTLISMLAMDTESSVDIMNKYVIMKGYRPNTEKMLSGTTPWPLFGGQQITSVAAENILNADNAMLMHQAYSEARDIMSGLIIDLTVGKKTPEETIAEAVKQIQKVMDR